MIGIMEAQKWWDDVWELRDKRVDGWPMLGSIWPTLIMCTAYVFIVTVLGPWYMKNRKPFNISTFLVYYNFLQVILSAYIFITVRIFNPFVIPRFCLLEFMNDLKTEKKTCFYSYCLRDGEVTTASGASLWIIPTTRKPCW